MVKLAKMGHGPHSSKLVIICVVLLLFVLFYVLFVFVLFYVLFACKCVLYYCHRVLSQLQLTNISYHILIQFYFDGLLLIFLLRLFRITNVYILLTVHLSIILDNDQLDTHLLLFFTIRLL